MTQLRDDIEAAQYAGRARLSGPHLIPTGSWGTRGRLWLRLIWGQRRWGCKTTPSLLVSPSRCDFVDLVAFAAACKHHEYAEHRAANQDNNNNQHGQPLSVARDNNTLIQQ